MHVRLEATSFALLVLLSMTSRVSTGSDNATLDGTGRYEYLRYDKGVNPSAGDRSTELRIAVILPRNNTRMFSIAKVRPAIDLAIAGDAVRKLVPGFRWTVAYADSNCSGLSAPLVAFKNLQSADKVNAFFGPVCDYALAPVARYSPIWHTPVLTTGALSSDFGVNKNWEYPLLTRVGATLDSMSRCIEDTMLHFNWSKVKCSETEWTAVQRSPIIALAGLHVAERSVTVTALTVVVTMNLIYLIEPRL